MRYVKEIIIVILQIFLFFKAPTMVFEEHKVQMIILVAALTVILSFIIGLISSEKMKFYYPLIVAILFIISIFTDYGLSSFLLALAYLGISTIGMLLGAGIHIVICFFIRIFRKKKEEKLNKQS